MCWAKPKYSSSWGWGGQLFYDTVPNYVASNGTMVCGDKIGKYLDRSSRQQNRGNILA
jgi:hypothetical protein